MTTKQIDTEPTLGDEIFALGVELNKFQLMDEKPQLARLMLTRAELRVVLSGLISEARMFNTVAVGDETKAAAESALNKARAALEAM
jgi:hypothetical protein